MNSYTEHGFFESIARHHVLVPLRLVLFFLRPQHRLELRNRQHLVFRLRLLRRWSAGHQEVTEVLRRSETRLVVRTTLHDLALFRQVLASGGQRVLDRAHRAIEDGTHLLPFITDEFGNQLPALRRVRFA